jgi:hypothetical protein
MAYLDKLEIIGQYEADKILDIAERIVQPEFDLEEAQFEHLGVDIRINTDTIERFGLYVIKNVIKAEFGSSRTAHTSKRPITHETRKDAKLHLLGWLTTFDQEPFGIAKLKISAVKLRGGVHNYTYVDDCVFTMS